MGPLFVIIGGVILGAVVGSVLGLLFSFVAVPVYHAISETPMEKRKIVGYKKGIMVLVIMGGCAFLGGAGPLLFTVLEIINANDFERSTGLGDWCRMPLEHPFELATICGHQDADVRVWETKEIVVRAVTKYHRIDNLMVGERLKLIRDPEAVTTIDTVYSEEAVVSIDTTWQITPLERETAWFIFDFSTGRVIDFTEHQDYVAGLLECGIEPEPELRTIWQNWKW